MRPTVDQKKADAARPKRGTEFGDACQGDCALPTCERPRIVRADNFIVTLAGQLYHTGCWAKAGYR
jgi:hypothetical protein